MNSHEFLSLKQTTESVAKITKMITKRTLFCHKYASSEQVKMSRYLSILNTNIKEFVSKNRYITLAKIQEHARRRGIELETQKKEKWQIPTPSHPTSKKFKSNGSRFGNQKGRTCNKCRKFHDGPCRVGPRCHKCGKEGNYTRNDKHNMYICFSCN